MSIKTESLSIKYLNLEENINRNIVLLDYAGLETPLIKENYEEKIKNEKFREKLIAELFLQNFIIRNNDI